MLQLPRSSEELPKRVVWDAGKEEEALRAIEKLKARGFVETARCPGECLLSPPPLPQDIFLVRVLDESGDSRLVWNRKNLEEVKEARKKFQDYMEKGYRAYICRDDGKKGAKVDSFDALLEELILVEKSKAKPERPLRGTSGSAILVPPTTPG